MNRLYIIDRFEGDYVILETDDSKHIQIKIQEIPKQAKEGDCLILKNGVYSLDMTLTDNLRKKNADLQNGLWE